MWGQMAISLSDIVSELRLRCTSSFLRTHRLIVADSWSSTPFKLGDRDAGGNWALSAEQPFAVQSHADKVERY
jgi:hypothetical protein